MANIEYTNRAKGCGASALVLETGLSEFTIELFPVTIFGNPSTEASHPQPN
jgi:hypothetical protein